MTTSHPHPTSPGTSQDPEVLRAEIARTRSDMDATLAEVEDRVSPTRIKERQAEKVRSRWQSARESVMGSAEHAKERVAGGGTGSLGDAAHSAQDAVQRAPERVQQAATGNPLAAGLIAFGVGALAGSLLPASRPEEQVASGLRDTFEEPVKQQLQTSAQEVQGELQEHAQQAVEEVKEVAQDAAQTTKDEAQRSAEQVQSSAQGAADEVQQQR
jgi:gas vesicle protein